VSTIQEKINKYINDKGLLKTPAYYIKELLIGIIDKIDKIDETVDKVDKSIKASIE
jgi:endonuclease III